MLVSDKRKTIKYSRQTWRLPVAVKLDNCMIVYIVSDKCG